MVWLVGLMSGTSLDGVDAVLAQADASDHLHARAHVHVPFSTALREELLALNRSGSDELHRAALATHALMSVYAEAVAGLLRQSGIDASAVRALGAHGQTVRHRPGEFEGRGYTLQLVNGALLAELTGIDVVCDFRSRDVAAGGQGAPLVPAFHAAQFARPHEASAVLNIGGIANLTLLAADGGVLGFDTGPGNMLMDAWCQRHFGVAYDAGGEHAARGTLDSTLLRTLLAEPFFSRHPPKSTGRDLFNSMWLQRHLQDAPRRAEDVLATLAELTARSAVSALREHAPHTTAVLVCGGGAFNGHLMGRLASLLQAPGPTAAGKTTTVCSTAAHGVPPDQVEALAFAWLAARHLARQPGNLPAVTGARGPRVLGALYPAG